MDDGDTTTFSLYTEITLTSTSHIWINIYIGDSDDCDDFYLYKYTNAEYTITLRQIA